MEFSEVVRKRRMVRHFSTEPVDLEVIRRIVRIAHHAPSAGFTQGQSFIVVTRPEMRKAIARLCDEDEYVQSGHHPFVSEAPVQIIPCTSETAYHRRYQEPDKLDEQGREIVWPIPFWYVDIGCSVMNLLLAVVNEGLAAGYAGFTSVENIQTARELLKIPAEFEPVGVIPIGHPAPDLPSPSLKRGRKAESEYFHLEGW
jgi:FMN reductase [NAD(P)H]